MLTFFIRHAESTANAGGDAGKDPWLSPLGVEQAKAVIVYADVVLCSTLTRARLTLAHSAIPKGRVIYTDLCREIRAGNPCDYLPHEDTSVHETREQIDARVACLHSMVRWARDGRPDLVVGIVSHHCFIGHVFGVWTNNCQVVEAPGW